MKGVYIIIIIGLVFLSFIACSKKKLINPKKSHSYFKTKTKFFFIRNGNSFELGKTEFIADEETFEILNEDIAKDKTRVFYRGTKIDYIDYNSFYIEDNGFDKLGIPKDKNNVYKGNLVPIKGIKDPKTFRYLPNDYLNRTWAKDKFNIYFNYKKINVDRETFGFINKYFATDKDSLYAVIQNEIITIKTNPYKVVALNVQYVRDDNKLYYISFLHDLLILEFKNFNKVRVVSDYSICINDKVIHYGKIFDNENVDVNTFEIFNTSRKEFSKDKNYVYYKYEIIPDADSNTFHPLKYDFGKDSDNVFFKTSKLKNVDAKSFKYDESHLFFIDKNKATYNIEGIRIKN